MQQALVSIIIPFKNTASFLEECLNSIQKQSYDNWEVLAVNDHSTDKSYAVVHTYSLKDSRIKVLQNKGFGIIEALRTGYAESTGNFITRMDSDDIMTPKKLAIMVSSLLEHGIKHLAIGQVNYFSKDGIGNGYKKYANWLNELTAKGRNYSEIYKECVIPSPCWMLFREDFDACLGFEPNRYPEDYDLAFRFYKNKFQCIPCSTILHHWRDYSSRASRTSEHYAQNYFLDIKLHYFLSLEWKPNRPLVIWGAGNKGKTIAKKLIEKDTDFYWLCDNDKKIGKSIYDKQMLHFNHLKKLQKPQIIITVANEEDQKSIKNYLYTLDLENMNDYFFFC